MSVCGLMVSEFFGVPRLAMLDACAHFHSQDRAAQGCGASQSCCVAFCFGFQDVGPWPFSARHHPSGAVALVQIGLD